MDERDLGSGDPPEAEFWTPSRPHAGAAGRLERALAVVICTYARPASLVRCVASLKRQTRRADTLLVVDASRDDLSEKALASDPDLGSAAGRVGYLRVGDRQRGLTRQRNVALGRITDDLVAFFDDDIVLRPGASRRWSSSTGPPQAAVGVGAVIEGQPETRTRSGGSAGRSGSSRRSRPAATAAPGCPIPWSFLRQDEGVAEGDWLPGGAVMWRTEDARAVGFNEDFAGYGQGEDLDFSLRVARRGRLLMACAARLEHLHEEAGRPDPYRVGYMAISNRYEIHRRGLADRTAKDILWFAYAWSVDSLLLLRHAVVPGRASGVLRQLAGRTRAAWDLVRAA